MWFTGIIHSRISLTNLGCNHWPHILWHKSVKSLVVFFQFWCPDQGFHGLPLTPKKHVLWKLRRSKRLFATEVGCVSQFRLLGFRNWSKNRVSQSKKLVPCKSNEEFDQEKALGWSWKNMVNGWCENWVMVRSCCNMLYSNLQRDRTVIFLLFSLRFYMSTFGWYLLLTYRMVLELC